VDRLFGVTEIDRSPTIAFDPPDSGECDQLATLVECQVAPIPELT